MQIRLAFRDNQISMKPRYETVLWVCLANMKILRATASVVRLFPFRRRLDVLCSLYEMDCLNQAYLLIKGEDAGKVSSTEAQKGLREVQYLMAKNEVRRMKGEPWTKRRAHFYSH